MRIDGNVFLVTGGASGLGEGTAQLLAEHGAKIVIGDVSRAKGEALAQKIGSNARFIEMNVADESAARAAVALAVNTFGGLHGLVNAAGVVHGEKIVGKHGTHTMASFRRMVEVNLVGTFNMVCAVAEYMAKAKPSPSGERGVIVNTASVAAFEGQIGQAAYSASKAGVAGMTLPIARELARFGIRVMTIAPGIFETPMVAAMSAEVQASLGAQVPFPSRLGRPAEYAALVEHIISNPMLNGAVIRLDGAIRMGPK